MASFAANPLPEMLADDPTDPVSGVREMEALTVAVSGALVAVQVRQTAVTV